MTVDIIHAKYKWRINWFFYQIAQVWKDWGHVFILFVFSAALCPDHRMGKAGWGEREVRRERKKRHEWFGYFCRECYLGINSAGVKEKQNQNFMHTEKSKRHQSECCSFSSIADGPWVRSSLHLGCLLHGTGTVRS